MTSGRDSRHSERNASGTDWAHVFRISLLPIVAGLRSSHKLKRVSAADRRGVLCVVASQDGRKGSLLIRQHASIYSAMFDPGQHLIHELLPGHRAWLHVVRGEATLGDDVLVAGDGAGIAAEPAISFTARTEGEILLFDLCEEVPMSSSDDLPDSAPSPERRDTGGLQVWGTDGGA
jgi:redox-sensitive bicupin YhaK (pirin superfamily)